MKGDYKKILILMITVIIIIIFIIGILLIVTSKKKKDEENGKNFSTILSEDEIKVTNPSITEGRYYDVTVLTRGYYSALNKSNYSDRAGNSYAQDENVKKSIYSLLSSDYIEKEKITVENVYEHLPDINETVKFVPTEMKLFSGEEIYTYIVKGIAIYTFSEKTEEVAFIVNIDYTNYAFSLEPIDIKDLESVTLSNTRIVQNEYNKYEYNTATNLELVKEKFNNFKLLILNQNEEVYKMLDEEYKDKKFENYQEFEDYVEKNYEKLSTMSLSKYKKDEDEGSIQYVCIDNYNNYVIFKDDKIILDTYTIDLPEFLEKYNKADDKTKAGYNVEKFIGAINDKDYKFAYNLLDQVYKSKNMPELSDFENYVKENMYENNEVEYDSVEKSGNNFIYEIKLKDSNDENSTEKKMTIIMKLLEGTDFVMSFSMD